MINSIYSLRKQPAADSLLLFATVLTISSLLIRQFNDADVWWLLAIGRDIIANNAVPHVDHFTAAGWGRHYHDSHWLFQVVLAGADRLGGSVAVGSVAIIFWGGALTCCYRSLRRWLSTSASCLLLFLAALACNARFIPRPDIVSCFMIAVYYLLLQSGKYATVPDLVLFGILQVIWSNSHGLFVIGPFMAGCYLAEAAWNAYTGRPAALRQATGLLVVLLIATLITPFGLDGWRYAIQIAQQAGPYGHGIYKDLEELRPIFQASMLSYPDGMAFFLILSVFAGTAAPVILKGNSSVARLIIVIALFIAAAASGRRNIPLFSLAAVPLIAESISVLRPGFSMKKQATCAAAIIMVSFAALPVSGLYYQWFKYDPLRFGVGAPAEYQPSGFPAFLRQIGFSGQIYNNDLFGGYCMYHGIVPLIDGRWEVYEQDDLATILMAPYDKTSWDWVVHTYNIQGALVQNGAKETKALVARFIADKSFQQVYQDKVSTFWLRNPGTGNAP